MVNLYEYYKRFHHPLVPIIADMELRGVRVDMTHLTSIHKEYKSLLRDLYIQINDTLPRKIAPNNSYDRQWLLYSYKKFTPQLYTDGVRDKEKSETKNPSTSAQAIDLIRETLDESSSDYQLLTLLIHYIHIHKLFTSFIEPLLYEHIEDGVVHANFNQTGTTTGRLSSNSPNLQQVPKRTSEFISKHDIQNIRNCFIARKDHVLVDVDFDQLELKIAAYFSRDPYLLKAIREGKDMHKLGAVAYLGKDYNNISKEDRTLSKTLGFLLLYLGTVKKMVKVTQGKVMDDDGNILTGKALENKCQQMFNNWYDMMSNMIEWRDMTIEEAHKNERVYNAFGRQRFLPSINHEDKWKRSQYERFAVNTPIQSTAVDCCLYSMQRVDSLFNTFTGGILIQIHDSILSEVHKDQLDDYVDKKIEAMETSIDPIDIPLTVEAEIGTQWGAMTVYGEE